MVGWSLEAGAWADTLRHELLFVHSPALALGAAALVGFLVGGEALASSSRWTHSSLALFFGHAAVWFLANAFGSSVGYGGDDPSSVYQWGAVASVAVPVAVALVLALRRPSEPTYPTTDRALLINVLSCLLGLCAVVLYLVLGFIARSGATTELSASSEIANDIAFGRGDWLRAERYREIGGFCHNSCGKHYVPPPGPQILQRRGRAAVPAIVAVLQRVRLADTIHQDSDLESLDRIGALLRLLESHEGEGSASELAEWRKDKQRYAALLRGEPEPI